MAQTGSHCIARLCTADATANAAIAPTHQPSAPIATPGRSRGFASAARGARRLPIQSR
ncbi:hypothetical protein D3C85_646960 [compost metagenome]